MDTLHLVGRIGNRSFGLGAAAVGLAKGQAALGIETHLWCLDEEDAVQLIAPQLPTTKIRRFPILGPDRFGISPTLLREARHLKELPRIVHQHGIWAQFSAATAHFANRGVRTIVAPQGALEPWAMDRAKLKKSLARWMYEGRNLESAACIHAVGEHEIESIRAFGLRNPIAVIPNGVDGILEKDPEAANKFRAQHGLPTRARVLLFISRVSPKKGLPMMLRALAALKDQLSDWVCVIAGPDENGHANEVLQSIRHLNLEAHVRLVGPVFGAAKLGALSSAEVFILPSFSEGSPLAVLEAMAIGLPVITTFGSSLPEIAEYRAGWWTPSTEVAIAGALNEALGYSNERLSECGTRARQIVTDRYTWGSISEQMVGLYDWVCGKGECPSFVDVWKPTVRVAG